MLQILRSGFVIQKHKEGLSVEAIAKLIMQQVRAENAVRKKDERITMTEKEARRRVEETIMRGWG